MARKRVNSRRRAAPPLAAALGASHTFTISREPQGPFGVEALRDEIQTRLVSRGGRPAAPGPSVRRLVPIKKDVWRNLKHQAEMLSREGRRVSPAQLAALLVEKSVSAMKKAD